MRIIRWVLALVVALGAAVTAAAPAYAIPSADGWVWASQPASAFYVAATGYEYSSVGAPIQITRMGFGQYQVRFVGLGTPGGVPHVWAYGINNSGYCQVAGWGMSGADEVVGVRCYDGFGAFLDQRYVVTFTNRKPSGPFVYLWSNQPAPPAAYVPPAPTSYDSTGSPLVVERTAVGHYRIHSKAITTFGTYDGNYRATPVSGAVPAKCAVMEPQPTYVEVICLTVGPFTPVDTQFTFSAGTGVNVVGESTPNATAVVWPNPMAPPTVKGRSGPGGAPTAVELFPGTYQVSFPGMASLKGLAVANAFGIVPFYCHAAGWFPSGTAEIVQVECHNPPPALDHTPAFFTVAFTA